MKEITPNEEQKQAIAAPLPCLVTAGAGTGKTYVLVERYIEILKKSDAMPSEIVAFTFTTSAADEMLERIRKRVKHLASNNGSAPNERSRWKTIYEAMDEARISTIHSFCAALLFEYPLESGVPPDYAVLSDIEEAIFIEEAISNALDELGDAFFDGLKPENVEPTVRRLVNESFVLGKSSSDLMKWNEETAEQLFQEPEIKEDEEGWKEWRKKREKFYEAAAKALDNFEKFKRGGMRKAWEKSGRWMTYNDLQSAVSRLFRERADVIKRVREGVKYLLVDESQDIDPLQKEIIAASTAVADSDGKYGNLFMVGDPKQAIFGFRGSDEKFLERFERDEGVEKVYLVKNFRSGENILKFVNGFFGTVLGGAEANRGKGDSEKKILECGTDAQKGKGELEFWLFTLEEYRGNHDLKVETRHIMNEIDRLVGEGYKYEEIAVLSRKNETLEAIADSFLKRRIPFSLSIEMNIWDKQPVRELGYLLEALLNPNDDLNFASLLRTPFAGVSKDTLLKLFLYKEPEHSLFETLTNGKPCDGMAEKEWSKIEKFLRFFSETLKTARLDSPPEIVMKIYDEFQPVALYSALYPEKSATFPFILDAFLNSVRLLTPKKGELPLLIHRLKQAEDYGRNIKISENTPAVRKNAVTLSTIHRAKGLEWRAVFVAHSAEILKPKPPYYHPRFGVSTMNDSKFNKAIKREADEKEFAELKRLFYVALTRAKERLYITGLKPTEAGKSFNGILYGNLLEWKKYCEDVRKQGLRERKEPDEKNFFEVSVKIKVQRGDTLPSIIVEKSSSETIDSSSPVRPPSYDEVERDIARIETPPVRENKVPAMTIAAYSVCPWRFKQNVGSNGEEREKEFISTSRLFEGGTSADFGSLFHSVIALANFDATMEEESDRLLSIAKNRESQSLFDSDKLRNHLNAALSSEKIRNIAGGAKNIFKEYPFFLPVVAANDRHIVSGKIDFLAVNESEVFIVDYKTGEIGEKSEKEAHRRQLLAYACAIRKHNSLAREKIRAALFYTGHNEWLEFDFSKQEIDDFLKSLPEDIEKYHRKDDEKRKGEHCNLCPDKERCANE
ncbi:MAG: hypothetical protein Kow0090_01370 [Myxococcota bacterium]